jgi:hypothetical protein
VRGVSRDKHPDPYSGAMVCLLKGQERKKKNWNFFKQRLFTLEIKIAVKIDIKIKIRDQLGSKLISVPNTRGQILKSLEYIGYRGEGGGREVHQSLVQPPIIPSL